VVKTGFVLRDFGQTNEQQRRFNEKPISELHEDVDSNQRSLNLLFTLQQYWNVVSAFKLWPVPLSSYL
jgi:hypothetical protein